MDATGHGVYVLRGTAPLVPPPGLSIEFAKVDLRRIEASAVGRRADDGASEACAVELTSAILPISFVAGDGVDDEEGAWEVAGRGVLRRMLGITYRAEDIREMDQECM